MIKFWSWTKIGQILTKLGLANDRLYLWAWALRMGEWRLIAKFLGVFILPSSAAWDCYFDNPNASSQFPTTPLFLWDYFIHFWFIEFGGRNHFWFGLASIGCWQTKRIFDYFYQMNFRLISKWCDFYSFLSLKFWLKHFSIKYYYY